MNTRPSWDSYFMDMCEVVSSRGTCDRKQVGAVLVKNKRPIATGYNGSIPGEPHCSDPDLFWECKLCGTKYEHDPNKDAGYELGDHKPMINALCDGLDCWSDKIILRKGGHDLEDNHCVRTVHAEVNAVTQAARLGIPTEGAKMYCNTKPCWNCFKTIIAAGIVEVIYRDEYDSQHTSKVIQIASEIPGFTLRRYLPTPT